MILNDAFMEAISEFNAEDFKDCMTKTYNYAVNGVEPNFESSNCKMVFSLFKPFIDSNNAKYEQKQKDYQKMNGGN